MKNLVKISLVFMACFGISTLAVAQTANQTKKEAREGAVKKQIEGRTFTFNANFAYPLHGGQRYLTPYYDLRLTKDSVIAFLPYFGQVYMNASLNPDDNGIMFNTVKFNYQIVPMKKGGWNITIIPSDAKYVSKMLLEVYSNGNANLQVLSNFRDEIRFEGEIKTP
jgi:hypothetical protein